MSTPSKSILDFAQIEKLNENNGDIWHRKTQSILEDVNNSMVTPNDKSPRSDNDIEAYNAGVHNVMF